jgi:hypothetical protein
MNVNFVIYECNFLKDMLFFKTWHSEPRTCGPFKKGLGSFTCIFICIYLKNTTDRRSWLKNARF